MYYAHKPGAVDVKKLVASAPGIEQQLERLTAQLRKQLSILQRGIETHVLPVTEQYVPGVLVWSPLASRWLSGAVREGLETTTSRSSVMPESFDTVIPSNRARLDAVERLAGVAEEAGLTMIQLALGFVTAHPAVTRAIIGPRTLDHLRSQLAAADTVLSADVLDAIDPIDAPGVDLAAHEKFAPRPRSSTRRCGAADRPRVFRPFVRRRSGAGGHR